MSLILKNSYDVRRAIGKCGRCAVDVSDGATCKDCRAKVSGRVNAWRRANRSHYNALMRTWKATRVREYSDTTETKSV